MHGFDSPSYDDASLVRRDGARDAQHARARHYERDGDLVASMPYPDTAAVLKELKARGVRIGTLSDIRYHLRPHFENFHLAQSIDAFTLSFERGVQKPDPRLFKIALEQLGARPAYTSYVWLRTPDRPRGSLMACQSLPATTAWYAGAPQRHSIGQVGETGRHELPSRACTQMHPNARTRIRAAAPVAAPRPILGPRKADFEMEIGQVERVWDRLPPSAPD